MSRRAVVLWTLAVALLSVVLVLMPRAESGDTTLALRRFLATMGLRVSEGGSPPESGTFVLLQDLRTGEEARSLLRWAGDGGRLVVADPASAIPALSGARPAAPVGLAGNETLEPGCVTEEIVGVRAIAARASDWSFAPGGPFVSCFHTDGGGYLLVRGYGEGTVVLIGGRSSLTNELLRAEDNALWALRLVGDGPEVVFGPPQPPSAADSSGGLWATLPPAAKVVIVAIALAAVAFALVRGRRLGRPVREEPLAPIPASELVRATGRLYRRGRTPAYAGRLMREATRARVARRLGTRGEPTELAAILAGTTGMSGKDVEEALTGREPASDEELIRLGRLLSEVERRIGERSR